MQEAGRSMRINKYITGGIACFFYGALTTTAFAPFEYFIFAIISPALLFNAWLNASPRKALCIGFLYGLGMFGTGVNWLHISINLFGGMNLTGAILVTFLLIAFLSLYPAVVGYAARKYFAKSKLISLMIVFPVLWILAEWCRSWIFTGFPWLNLGYSHTGTPLNGLAPVLGIYGVGLASVFTSSVLVGLFYSTNRQRLILAGMVIVIWTVSWMLQGTAWTKESRTDYRVALIQGAIPQNIKWNPDMHQPSLDLYLELSSSNWDSDLIVWPETAIPGFYHRELEVINTLQEMAQTTGTDVITGIVVTDQETGRYYNTMLLINRSTHTYYKKHLVPFGEYMPFDALLRPLLKFLEIPMSDFSPGDRAEKPLLHATGSIIGASICYEDAFGEEVISALPEAGILVNISNDAWFGDSIAPHQHLQMARMRALETGRYLLRSTNTGITAIINEKGKIIARSEQFQPNSTRALVALFTGMTPYARYGNWPIITFLIIVLVGLRLKGLRGLSKSLNP